VVHAIDETKIFIALNSVFQAIKVPLHRFGFSSVIHCLKIYSKQHILAEYSWCEENITMSSLIIKGGTCLDIGNITKVF